MSKIRLFGASSGYVEIAPAAAASNNTLTAPSTVGEIIAKDAAGAIGVTSVHTTNITATGIATITTAKIGAGVTISESGIDASGIGITCANINGGAISGRRNIVINGKALINQRGDSTGNTSSGYYGPDRFETTLYGGTYSHSSAASGSTLPEFPRCFRIDCTSTASAPSGSNETKIKYHMEGQDVQHLQYGTSSAKTTTLSFYVRSNKTETYTVWFYRPDGSRMNAVNFSVSAANTWEKKVITIVGDTTSAIADDNTMGYKIEWILAAGPSYTSGSALNGTWGALNSANRYVGNTGTFGQSTDDYFDLTGVQYEVGSQATEFEHRTAGDELALCQRYYQVLATGDQAVIGNGFAFQTNRFQCNCHLPVEMRTVPSLDEQMTGGTKYRINMGNSDQNTGITPSLSSIISNTRTINLGWSSLGSNVTNGDGGQIRKQSDSGILGVDAEL